MLNYFNFLNIFILILDTHEDQMFSSIFYFSV